MRVYYPYVHNAFRCNDVTRCSKLLSRKTAD